MSQLVISRLDDAQEPEQIAHIVADKILIGRTPAPMGIAIDKKSVSSSHGQFFEAGAAWFYRDLNSTNGSYFQGKKLLPADPLLIKDGDELRLSDQKLKLELVFDPETRKVAEQNNPHVYVFWQDQFFEFLPLVPGTSIYLGGSRSNLTLPQDFVLDHRFLISSDQSGVLNIQIEQTESAVMIDDSKVDAGANAVTISERQVFKAGGLQIVYCAGFDFSQADHSKLSSKTIVDKNYHYTKRVKAAANSSFGKGVSPSDNDESRIATAAFRHQNSGNAVRFDFVIYGIAFLMLVIALAILIWIIAAA